MISNTDTDIDKVINSERKVLYTLNDITEKSYTYTHPVLTTNLSEDYWRRASIINDPKQVFYKKMPFFDRKSDMKNIVIAGGSVVDVLLNRSYSSDIDIFIYHPDKNTEFASMRAKEVCMSIITAVYKKKQWDDYEQNKKRNPKQKLTPPLSPTKADIDTYHKSGKFEFIRNSTSITMRFFVFGKKFKIQIILRLYNSVSEILNGFDVDCCAVGFDGEFHFTEASKFAFEYGCNILNPARRSPSYENRLTKYINRGFDIIMYKFNINKLDTTYIDKYRLEQVCQLPMCSFSFKKYNDKRIQLNTFYLHDHHDYENDELDEFQCFHVNLHKLLNDSTTLYYSITQFPDADTKPTIDKNNVYLYYSNQIEKAVSSESVSMKLLRLCKGINQQKIINTLTHPKWDKKRKLSVMMALVAPLIDKLNGQIDSIDNTIIWKTKNPGSQHTASFNPTPTSFKEYYGPYLKV